MMRDVSRCGEEFSLRAFRGVGAVAAGCVIVSMLAGCAQEGATTRFRHINKTGDAPAVKYCCDATGHKRGTQPFIFGGTCCCTPNAELLGQYQADGFLKGYTVSRLESAYSGRGIKTDSDHQGCNNMCQFGPHAVKGGHCMATPTPGTLAYEEIVTGQFIRMADQENPKDE